MSNTEPHFCSDRQSETDGSRQRQTETDDSHTSSHSSSFSSIACLLLHSCSSVHAIQMTEPYGGATLSSATDISLQKYQMSVESALESLDAINNVTVTMATAAGTPVTSSVACASSPGIDIAIDFGHEFGDLPPVSVTSTALTSPTITISETKAGKKENSECSEKGICDRTTGRCKCFPGFFTSDGYGGIGLRGDCGAFDANAQ